MTSFETPVPAVPDQGWRWCRLWLAAFGVRTMLVAQVFLALLHYVKVPDRIVALSHVHEPVRSLRLQRIDAVLQDSTQLQNIWLCVTVATALAFACWLWSAYSVLDRPGDERCFGRVWAFVAWFIPFANLHVPKQILNDIVGAQERHDRPAAEATFVRNWVTAWWACWVVLAVGTVWVHHNSATATTVVSAQNAELMYAVCDFVVFVTVVIAWTAVKRVTRGQGQLLASPPGHGDLPSSSGDSHFDAVGHDA